MFDQEMRNILAAGAVLGFGCSDDEAVMIMNATVSDRHRGIGLGISKIFQMRPFPKECLT